MSWVQRSRIAILFFCLGLFCLSQQPRAYWQSRDSNYNVAISGAAAYVGPGNIVGSATASWGFFAYNAAYGTGSAFDVCDVATGAVCSTVNYLSSGVWNKAAAQALTQCSVSCNISKAYDSTGNGNHVTQATNSKRPVISFAGGPGSLSVATCDGTSQEMTVATALTFVSPFSSAAVALRTTGSARKAISGINDFPEFGFFTAGNSWLTASSEFSGSADAANGAFHAIQAVFDQTSASSASISSDGVTTSGNSGSIGTVTSAIMAICSGSGGEFLNGSWGETTWWGTLALSGANISALNSNAHTRWGF